MSNYEFAFNNPKYADRKIRFVIQEEEEEKNSEEEEAEEEEEEEEGDEEEEEDLKPQSLERALKRRRCNSCDKSLSAQVEREEIHVNRIILGKESLYFRRIFDGDCFKECSEKVIEIALNPEEKESFVDLIKYMYTNKLEAHTVEELLHVWDLSQRFLVESCGTLCLQRMISLPLSLESSCYFLDSAAVVNQTEEFKALVAKSIAFLANHFRVSLVMNGEISSRWENSEDLAKLSSNVLETLLTTDDLQVVYEDSVYYAVRTWIRANCKGTQDEKEAWDRFGPLIRWPMIEMFRIKALLGKMECNALHGLLLEALLYHASTDEEKEAMEMTNMSNNNRFRRRGRHAMPVKFISVTSPVCHGMILFSISIKEWKCLQDSSGPVFTERFIMAGCVFIWLAQVRTISRKRVSILLVALDTPPSSFRVWISLSIWNAVRSTYVLRYTGVHSVRKDVKERVAMCLDCFGKDVDEIVKDCEFMHKDATWFKAEVQVSEAE